MPKPALVPLPVATLLVTLLACPVAAQDLRPRDRSADAPHTQTAQSERLAPSAERRHEPRYLDRDSFAVERAELTPVMAADGSGLPFELWRGLDVATLESLVAELDIPPKSPALHGLWLRLITSSVTPPAGGEADQQFMALRLEILYRSGLLEEASRSLATMPAGNALVATLAARNDVALGRYEQGCAKARSAAPNATFPKPLKAQAALISGYCAVLEQDRAGAGLAADIAREQGMRNSAALKALYDYSVGQIRAASPSQRLSLIDYRILEAIGGRVHPVGLLKKGAAPSLLAALALDAQIQSELKLIAAEAAAQVNAISPEQLAAIYRAQATPNDPLAKTPNTPEQRAQLFVAAEAERTPLKKVRLIRSFLDAARRSGLYLTALRMVAPASETIVLAQEIGWYAETGIEVAVAAGDYELARNWATFASALGGPGYATLGHWLALIDIADDDAQGDRNAALQHVEELAVRGRLDPTLLHRLATVLDALEYNVPIPLWEAASRTPQPAGGHLPETGVLSQLQDAAKRREFGRTVLLTMKTLGPDGAEGAHMIALGDAIRALKQAGLERDARRLGFEALFASWPRAIVN